MDCPKCGAGDYYASIFGGRNLCMNPECEDARDDAAAKAKANPVPDDCEECGADPGECNVYCGQYVQLGLEELIELHGIECSAVMGANHDPAPADWGRMISYGVTLTRPYGASMYVLRVDFHVGTAHGAPDAEDVINCLVQDALSLENSTGFEDWAENLGYDPDSRKAEKIYKAVEEQSELIRDFLGDHFESFSQAEY